MHFTLAAVAALAGHAVALRVPVKDVREEKAVLAKRNAAQEIEGVFNDLQKRLVCYEDDTLLSLQMYREDAEPFCSDYLGLGKQTVTTTITPKTTINTITGTNYYTVVGGTQTVGATTVTITAAAKLRKRDDGVEPAASVISSCSESPLNKTLISMVSSGCSCLRPTSLTLTSTVTQTSTRTINGYDDEDVTITSTVTVPTVTVTVYTTQGSVVYSTGTMYTTPIMSTGAMPTSSGTRPIPPRPTQTPDTRVAPTIGSSSSTGGPAASGSSTGASGMPSGASNMTSSGTGFPTFVPPTQTPDTRIFPTGASTTFGPGTTTYPVMSSASGMPTGVSNMSSSAPYGTGMSTGTSSAPLSTPTLDHCPMDNGTTFTYLCQEFQVQCQINYPGPVDQGLYEPDLYECIKGCAIANRGFSKPQCYAISYMPSNEGNNCFFKTQHDASMPETDELVVSALLINPNACPKNTTTSMKPTGTSSGLFPTLPTNGTIPIPTLTLPSGSRLPGIPSMSGNSSSMMTGTALATSRGASTGIPSISANISIPLPTVSLSTGVSLTLPLITANLTTPMLPTGFPTITAPSRVFPSISANMTSSMNGTSSSSVCPTTNTITTTVLSTTTSVIYVTITVPAA